MSEVRTDGDFNFNQGDKHSCLDPRVECGLVYNFISLAQARAPAVSKTSTREPHAQHLAASTRKPPDSDLISQWRSSALNVVVSRMRREHSANHSPRTNSGSRPLEDEDELKRRTEFSELRTRSSTFPSRAAAQQTAKNKRVNELLYKCLRSSNGGPKVFKCALHRESRLHLQVIN